MFVNRSLLFVAVLIVCVTLCGCTSSSSTVDAALNVTFNNGSILVLEEQYFSASFPKMQQTGVAPDQYDWSMSLVQRSSFHGECPWGHSQYIMQGHYCNQALFPNAPSSATSNSDGSGIQLVYKATIGEMPWLATLDIVCDPSHETLFSPTNSYTAAIRSADVVISFALASKGACLSSAPPPTPVPPLTPAPTPTPPPTVTFNNGSQLVLRNRYFSGIYNLYESESAQRNKTVFLSLITSTNFQGPCYPLNQNIYIGIASVDRLRISCVGSIASFAPFHSATPNQDGSGIQLLFKSVFGQQTSQYTFDILCDPSAEKLYSPSGNYTGNTTSYQPSVNVVYTFKMASKGACLPPAPTPPPTLSPPTPSPSSPSTSSPTITFNNGSKLTMQEKYFYRGTYQLEQRGLAPGNKIIYLSLATSSMFHDLCATFVYFAVGPFCTEVIASNPAYSATPNEDGSGIQLIYKTSVGQTPYQIAFTILCDPSAEEIYSPSGGYNVYQPYADVIYSLVLASKGACLPPAPPSPPAPPPSDRVVYFNNGSSVTLNKFFFTANFPQMAQQGLAPQKDNIGMSLVVPSNFDSTCRNASFISMNKCTGALFDSAALYVTPNSAQSGLEFVFQGSSRDGLIWQANVNVVCDLSRNVLTSPTNTYHANAPGSRVILNFNMTSRGACIDQNF